jgi:hypothetical protein
MAKPRIFISSTYYDLKHIRYSLDIFISELGYETILSEKGDIAYSYEIPLDESCYKEVENVDMFVLIIGGRYGTETSSSEKKPDKKFYDRYESITKKEYDSAVKKDIPIYILIESNVYSEYRTFLKNKENSTVNYAHADSVNIFHFVEDILSKPRNNPIQSFEKFDDIEIWLKEQWSGLFRDLLNKKSSQNQIRTLTTEVSELQEINKTLKTYLEEILKNSNPHSKEVIEKEDKRLLDISVRKELENNRWIMQCMHAYKESFDSAIDQIRNSSSIKDIALKLKKEYREEAEGLLETTPEAIEDINRIRQILNLKKLK